MPGQVIYGGAPIVIQVEEEDPIILSQVGFLHCKRYAAISPKKAFSLLSPVVLDIYLSHGGNTIRLGYVWHRTNEL